MDITLNKPSRIFTVSPTDITSPCGYKAKTRRQNFSELPTATLPAGTYKVPAAHKIVPLRPVKGFKMPMPEKRISKKYRLEYSNNPNTGSINHKTGIITLDTRLEKAPKNIREFIFLHEIAHKLYNNEHYCDLYAAQNMKKRGYNNADIIEASANFRGINSPLTQKLIEKFKP